MNAEKQTDRSKKFLRITIAAILLAIVLLAVIKPKKPVYTKTAEKPAEVVTVTVRPTSFADILYMPARIEPVSQAEVAVEKPGVVTAIEADRGARVTKGQVLLRLDDRQARLAASQAELEYRTAGDEMKRWEALKPAGGVSDSNYESIRTRCEMAGLTWSNALLFLAKCEVRSPIAGTVDDRHIELGENAADGARVVRVVNIDRVKLTADVPERDIPFVKADQDLTFQTDVLPGAVFTGKVSFVSAAADRMSATFRIEMQADNSDGRLRPGMTATVALTRRMREGVVVLPLGAIIPRKGDHVVFVVSNNAAMRRLVKIDQITGSEAVIGSGLADGEEVAVEGNRTLADGMPVIVRDGKMKAQDEQKAD